MSSTTTDEVAMKQIKLPDEIWLEVFKLDPTEVNSYRNDYYAYLKKCCRISKHFRTLIDSPIFDKDLFRTPAPVEITSKEKVDNKTKILLHPVLDTIDFVCTDHSQALVRMNDWKDPSQERIDEMLAYPCFSEFATFPASTTIFLQLGEGDIVQNDEGVKVGDLLEAAIECWNAPPDPYMAQEMVDSEFDSGWGPKTSVEEVTLIDMLGDHRFFEGFSARFETIPFLGGRLITLDPRYGS